MRFSQLRQRFVPGLAGVLAITCVVSLTAQKPEMTIEKLIDVVEPVNPAACPGLTLTSTVNGTIRTKLFFDKDDEFVRDLISAHIHGSFTNVANGKSVDFVVAENSSFKVYPDGSATLVFNGLTGRATVPGEGLVAADVGRLILFFEDENDVDPDVIFEAGRHDNGPFPGLCFVLE
jgi:hypothetical protein